MNWESAMSMYFTIHHLNKFYNGYNRLIVKCLHIHLQAVVCWYTWFRKSGADGRHSWFSCAHKWTRSNALGRIRNCDKSCSCGRCHNCSRYAFVTMIYSSTGVIPFIFYYSCRNSIPPTTTVENLEEKMKAATDHISVDVAFWGGIIPDNQVCSYSSRLTN